MLTHDPFEQVPVMDQSLALAIFLHVNPGVIVRDIKSGKVHYFVYDDSTDLFYWRCPEHKVYNKWYPARGLKHYYDHYFSSHSEEVSE